MRVNRKLCVGLPVVYESGVGIISAVDESLTGRPRIDIHEGSRGLNENEIDHIVEIVGEPRQYRSETENKTFTSSFDYFVVSETGEKIAVEREMFDRAAKYCFSPVLAKDPPPSR